MPPRHMKSTIVSVMWPTWEWLNFPHLRYLCCSYAENLSIRDNMKCRRIILSEWFQYHFGHLFFITGDQSAKKKFENNYYGFRLATSVTGLGTGEGGDRIIVDDPNNCLTYNTQVIVKFGTLPIGRMVEEKLPTEVLCYNQRKNKVEFKRILRHFCTKTAKIIDIFTKNGKLEITPNHPVFVLGKGYIEAFRVKHGDLLRTNENQQVWVTEVKERDVEECFMYNIEVEDNNNYFANGYLVHNCNESESDAVLETTRLWWTETMPTRLNDQNTGAKICVQQRTGQRDLSGVILEQGGYEHLILPAEYEGKKHRTIIGWEDPRNNDGELLWPAKVGREAIEALKKQLGSYAYAGQFQQRPAPREGGLIKLAWFGYYRLYRDQYGYLISPIFKNVYQVWDTSFKEGEENDFSVCLTFGLGESGYYLISRFKKKVDFPTLEKTAILLANQYKPQQIFIEDKASGQSLIQVLRKRTTLPIKAVKADRDKVARLNAVSGYIEAGRLILPEGEPWLEDYIEELTTFPAGKHDDQVDATVHFLMNIALGRDTPHQAHGNGSILGR